MADPTNVGRNLEEGPLFLAFDLSTQTLKTMAIDEKFNIYCELVVSFDKDLPAFGTSGGVTCHESSEVTSPVLMWVQAVDMILEQLSMTNFPFHRVKGISGTGQQHGSVYWIKNAHNILTTLDPRRNILSQLKDSFAIYQSPVWMDSSTTEQCRNLESVVGGAEQLSKITGSRAYERFTGNQIAKIYLVNKNAYECTERISLVSSFLASLFLGNYAPIDFSDASGMNLLNIHSKQWEKKLTDACAPDLIPRLGMPVSSKTKLGCISEYMVKRYGFCKDCEVIAFTGDNPASLAGMRLCDGDVAVSLGTSDTLVFWLKEPKSGLIGNVFVNPLEDEHYMAMLCYKNGSLAREHIRDAANIHSWNDFEKSLNRTKPGNGGNIGIYFIEQEIFPFARGVLRWNSRNELVDTFERDVEVRALVEGQFLAKKIHAEDLGFEFQKECTILATGGGSRNTSVLQVLADVFNCPVYQIENTTNSACLGSAYRAKYLTTDSNNMPFLEAVRDAKSPTLAATPSQQGVEAYNNIFDRYKQNEMFITLK